MISVIIISFIIPCLSVCLRGRSHWLSHSIFDSFLSKSFILIPSSRIHSPASDQSARKYFHTALSDMKESRADPSHRVARATNVCSSFRLPHAAAEKVTVSDVIIFSVFILFGIEKKSRKLLFTYYHRIICWPSPPRCRMVADVRKLKKCDVIVYK